MQSPENLKYGDLVGEVSAFLSKAASKAMDCGVGRDSILLDPGLGFSKDLDQNVELMLRMDEFSKLIVNGICQLRKVLPRCNEAFNRLEKSVDLLKNNFKGYYRDSQASSNPSKP